MTYQLRISKGGINALTDTDPNNYIYHSAYSTLKIIATGTATGSSTTTTIAHGRSYTPLAYAIVKRDSNAFAWSPRNGSFDELRVDGTNITVILGSAFAHTIRWYVFEIAF